MNNPFESDRNRIETLRFAATYHRGPAVLRVFPLQFYPGTPLYERARREGIIAERHDSAYRYTYTGKTHLLDSRYLDIWLRVVLNLRNVGVPRGLVHFLIDIVTNRAVRFTLDRRWFAPLALGVYRVGRFVVRKMIYQSFIRPLKHLRRGRRHEGGYINDEATLPRASIEVAPSPTPGESKEHESAGTPATR